MKLYRAVSDAEYSQLIKTSTWQIVAASVEGKYFAERAEHAIQWGYALFGTGQFRVVEVELPTILAHQFYRWERLDNIGAARYAAIEQLDKIVVKVREVDL